MNKLSGGVEMDMVRIKNAVVSVWDKTGLEELADAFRRYGIGVISTGKTAKKLKELGVKVREVSEYTASPEILSGRVKTLHPRLHAGILFRRDNKEDRKELHRIGGAPIDLVVVNLYPFKNAYLSGEKDLIEYIDIGGPTMLRAAAKNYKWVATLPDPSFYGRFLRELEKNKGAVSLSFRKRMAGEVFSITSKYDTWISNALFGSDFELSEESVIGLELKQQLRYGENPHQRAGFYLPFGSRSVFRQLQGKDLSYNNIMDLSAAWSMCSAFLPQTCAVVVKHANPCGLAIAKDVATAYKKAYNADPLSSFGGIIGINKTVDGRCAKEIVKSGFRECVIAPNFEKRALEILSEKKNLRVVEVKRHRPEFQIRQVFNGFLIQEPDLFFEKEEDLRVVSKKAPTRAQLRDLMFAFRVVRFVKSNAIVVARQQVVVGIGAGQMSRVGAVKIALDQAGDKGKGAVLASDAFFPKTDNIELAAKRGIKAIIQPSGSKADPEVISACDKFGIALLFAPTRHFLH